MFEVKKVGKLDKKVRKVIIKYLVSIKDDWDRVLLKNLLIMMDNVDKDFMFLDFNNLKLFLFSKVEVVRIMEVFNFVVKDIKKEEEVKFVRRV